MKTGTPMQQEMVRVRFVSDRGRRSRLNTEDIPQIRKLLRTDMSMAAIAESLGVPPTMLSRFVKARGIADLAQRNFIRTKILLTKGIPAHRSPMTWRPKQIHPRKGK